MKTETSINTNFLEEWRPFDQLKKMVERKILNHLMNKSYWFYPTHDIAIKERFKPYTFSQVENLLGLPYTSSSSYAGLWVCNGGHLMADNTHYFIGFAINTDNKVIGIAHDQEENEIFIEL